MRDVWASACENREMNAISTALLVCALLFAVLNWVAVARHTKVLEYVAKPAAASLFAATAASMDALDGSVQAWRVAALVMCIAGDVFLMLPSDAFVPGLASFAAAQVLFAASFVAEGPRAGRVWVALMLVVSCVVVLARRFIRALRNGGHRHLVAPVVLYMAVIAVMVVTGIAAGTSWAVVGAVLFLVSDSLIAENRFVSARPWHRVTIMVTYHGALLGLTLGLM